MAIAAAAGLASSVEVGEEGEGISNLTVRFAILCITFVVHIRLSTNISRFDWAKTFVVKAIQ